MLWIANHKPCQAENKYCMSKLKYEMGKFMVYIKVYSTLYTLQQIVATYKSLTNQ